MFLPRVNQEIELELWLFRLMATEIRNGKKIEGALEKGEKRANSIGSQAGGETEHRNNGVTMME